MTPFCCGPAPFGRTIGTARLSQIHHYLDNDNSKVIVTGCLPDIAPESIDFNPDRVVVANWKEDIQKLDDAFLPGKSLAPFRIIYTEERLCEDAAAYRRSNPGKDATFHDQFNKILVSEGCDFKCAYCSERLSGAGIICNCDGSELSVTRIERLKRG